MSVEGNRLRETQKNTDAMIKFGEFGVRYRNGFSKSGRSQRFTGYQSGKDGIRIKTIAIGPDAGNCA